LKAVKEKAQQDKVAKEKATKQKAANNKALQENRSQLKTEKTPTNDGHEEKGLRERTGSTRGQATLCHLA